MLFGLRDSVKRVFGLNFDTVFETLGDKKNKDIKIETLD
jgi:hypothetical protein